MSHQHVLMFAGEFTFVRDWAKLASSLVPVTLVDSPSASSAEIRRKYHSSDPFRQNSYDVTYLPEAGLRPSRVFASANRLRRESEVGTLINRLRGSSNGPVTQIHSHFYSNTPALLSVARRQGLPLVHTEHSSAILKGRVSRRGRQALVAVCEEAKHVFAVSDHLAAAMRELGVRRPISVVPNPVDVQLFASAPVTARYPVKAGKFRLITVARLHESKNLPTLLQGFALVLNRFPSAELRIVGGGPLRGRLEYLTRTLGIANSVVFVGEASRDDVGRLLSASHLYVHSSLSETYGVALVEAWASGLPVVAFECGGVALRTPELGGTLVKMSSPQGLAEAVVLELSLLSLPRRREVRQRAVSVFDPAPARSALAHAYGTEYLAQ